MILPWSAVASRERPLSPTVFKVDRSFAQKIATDAFGSAAEL
jgi:hypothetical protein